MSGNYCGCVNDMCTRRHRPPDDPPAAVGAAIELEDARKAYQRLARNSAAELAQLREENARLKRELQEWRDYFT